LSISCVSQSGIIDHRSRANAHAVEYGTRLLDLGIYVNIVFNTQTAVRFTPRRVLA